MQREGEGGRSLVDSGILLPISIVDCFEANGDRLAAQRFRGCNLHSDLVKIRDCNNARWVMAAVHE